MSYVFWLVLWFDIENHQAKGDAGVARVVSGPMLGVGEVMLGPPASSFTFFCNYTPRGDPSMLDSLQTRTAKLSEHILILVGFLSNWNENSSYTCLVQ